MKHLTPNCQFLINLAIHKIHLSLNNATNQNHYLQLNCSFYYSPKHKKRTKSDTLFMRLYHLTFKQNQIFIMNTLQFEKLYFSPRAH